MGWWLVAGRKFLPAAGYQLPIPALWDHSKIAIEPGCSRIRRPGLAFSGIDEADDAGKFYDNQLRQTSKIKPRTPNLPGERVPDGFLETLAAPSNHIIPAANAKETRQAPATWLRESSKCVFLGIKKSFTNPQKCVKICTIFCYFHSK